jgi:hypothetical protein
VTENKQYISKLSREIETERLTIDQLQRDKEIKIEEIKEKMTRDKDKEIR